MKHPDHQFAGLDHLRALAITFVVLYHYRAFHHPEWMDGLLNFGWSGVDLFFVLSGFLITNQLLARIKAGKNVGFRIFYLKRLFRIIPPYLTVLLVYIFVPAFHERESLSPLWKMFTFTQNFNLDIGTHGTFSHAWSLCVEEQFYLLLPLVLGLVVLTGSSPKTAWAIPGIFLLTAGIRMLIWHFQLAPLQDSDAFTLNWYKWIYYPTYTRLDGLITGVGIAAIYQHKEKWKLWVNRYANYFLLAAILFLLTAFFSDSDPHALFPSIFGFSLVALMYGLFVFSAISPRSLLFKIRSRITANLATLSYSLYLCHKGLIHVTQQLLEGTRVREDSNLMLLICLAVSIGGALLLRILVEKPFFALRDKLLSGSKPPTLS